VAMTAYGPAAVDREQRADLDEEDMVFALETYWAAADGRPAGRGLAT
jgi:hypothetical protein